ncbi:MAG: hypothetical protein M1828_004102 [Chrysothrix sp. TS-e1954]|nr:MAG: hypothetical protein M1828_004102 [Chrysothrix sp. TS-e1954]
MPKTLAGNVIAVTGDFGKTRNLNNIRRWIEAHHGTFASSMKPDVTHLICSKEHWRSKTKAVQQALTDKHIKIVTFDWLEDSLQSGRRKPPSPYLLKHVTKAAAKEKVTQRKKIKSLLKQEGQTKAPQPECDATNNPGTKPEPKTESSSSDPSITISPSEGAQAKYLSIAGRFDDGCEEAKRDLLCENYHTYRDSTAFCYRITLTRPNIAENKSERFVLHLYETNALPHLYALTATYTHPNTLPPKVYKLVAPSSGFQKAYTAWREFFLTRTGVPWDQRVWWAKQYPTTEARAAAFTRAQPPRAASTIASPVEEVVSGQVVEGAPNLAMTATEKKVAFAPDENDAPVSVQPKPSSTFFAYRLPLPTYITTPSGESEFNSISTSVGEIGQTQEMRDLLKGSQIRKNEVLGKFVGGGRLVGMSGVDGGFE